jgi:uncharacterized protein YndB with AHSA1/START domain
MNETTPDSTERRFNITRILDAPRDLVWKAWTEPERLKQWWGPKASTVRVANVDLRPGGVFHYCLEMPGSGELWGKFVYREVAAPERLVFIVSFSNPAAEILRNPWNAEWPLQTLSTLTLAEMEDRTRLTMEAVPQAATESERNAFEAGRGSLEQGWAGTLNQLAEYLART